MNGKLLLVLLGGCLLVQAIPGEKKEEKDPKELKQVDKDDGKMAWEDANQAETEQGPSPDSTNELAKPEDKDEKNNEGKAFAEPEGEGSDKDNEEKHLSEDEQNTTEKQEVQEESKDDDKHDSRSKTAKQPHDDAAPFACNLKFKRVGCYADKGKKERPLRSFIMSNEDLGETSKKGKLPNGDKFNSELPKFACKCANEAINAGNAVFGLQNLAECWTGPDDSKYDKDGASDDCVSFDYKKCDESAEICAGKKNSNFVFYVDNEEHTKTKADIKKEFTEWNKKVAAWKKKKTAKDAKKINKKAKKGKKAKKAKAE